MRLKHVMQRVFNFNIIMLLGAPHFFSHCVNRYRVVEGISVYDPKFNIVSPGADPEIYYPYDIPNKRLTSLHSDLENLLFGQTSDQATGTLMDPSKPILFSMARLDKVKNLTGLAAWFGSSQKLRKLVNLVIVGGVIKPEKSADKEEESECQKMHSIIEKYKLDGDFRWIVAQKNRVQNGELYRYICDTKGAFVQPALYEAFGLTVIEAMTCGLPTFATSKGGPAEIIKHGKSGFHIDPYHGTEAAKMMENFFEKVQEDPTYWTKISNSARERIFSRYTWDIYAARLVSLCDVYTFWNHVTSLERREAKRYLESIYILLLRGQIKKVRTFFA